MADKPKIKSAAQLRVNGEEVSTLAKKVKLSDKGKKINDVVLSHINKKKVKTKSKPKKKKKKKKKSS
jgi:hypothetical protein